MATAITDNTAMPPFISRMNRMALRRFSTEFGRGAAVEASPAPALAETVLRDPHATQCAGCAVT